MPEPEHSLAAWLTRLQRLNPNRIELGLERIRTVWQRMGSPLPGKKRIVIAGTNGKGSCTETMRRLGEACGLSVGCYTSPHLIRFNERIRLPTGEADDDRICAAFSAVEQARLDTHLSWFEFTTLAAFNLLAEAELDLALLEIGLGGRLDAVNLIDSDVAVVTGIALDHCEWLGDTLESIAAEKAAVYRSGCPAVCGEADPPGPLTEQIHQIGAHPVLCGKQYDWHMTDRDWRFCSDGADLPGLPLPGLPLAPCAAGLAAFLQIFPTIAPQKVHAAFTDLVLPGRMQVLPGSPQVLLDVAHNAQATQFLTDRVRQYLPATGQVHWICGISSDKDADTLLDAPLSLGGSWYPVRADNPRAAQTDVLASKLKSAGQQVNPVPQERVEAGIQAAFRRARPDDLLVVFGSFYTVGEALDLLVPGSSAR